MCAMMGAKVEEQSFTSFDGIGSSSHVLGGVFFRSDSISSEVVGLNEDNTAEVCTGSAAVKSGVKPQQMVSILDWKNLLKS